MKNLSIEQILNQYSFTDKFLITYAVACAETVLPIYEKQFPKDNRPRTAINMTKGYLKGINTKEDCYTAAYAAYAVASATTYTAANAANAAYAAAAAAAAHAASAAANAAYAAANAANAANAVGKDKDYYKQLLINMINELPEFERIMMGIDIS